MQDVHMKLIKSLSAMEKSNIQQHINAFHQQTGVAFKENN